MDLPPAVAAAAAAKPHCAVLLERLVEERVDPSGERARLVVNRWLQRCPEDRGAPALLDQREELSQLPRAAAGFAGTTRVSSVQVVAGDGAAAAGSGASGGGVGGGGELDVAAALAAAMGRWADGGGDVTSRGRRRAPPPGAVSL